MISKDKTDIYIISRSNKDAVARCRNIKVHIVNSIIVLIMVALFKHIEARVHI